MSALNLFVNQILICHCRTQIPELGHVITGSIKYPYGIICSASRDIDMYLQKKNIYQKIGDGVIKKIHVINCPFFENGCVLFTDVRVGSSLASFCSNTSPLNRMYTYKYFLHVKYFTFPLF
jgi:hypothetical protein